MRAARHKSRLMDLHTYRPTKGLKLRFDLCNRLSDCNLLATGIDDTLRRRMKCQVRIWCEDQRDGIRVNECGVPFRLSQFDKLCHSILHGEVESVLRRQPRVS